MVRHASEKSTAAGAPGLMTTRKPHLRVSEIQKRIIVIVAHHAEVLS
jgi:hypothetical protein